MVRFTPDGTIGDMLEAMTAIKDPKEAEIYASDYVEHLRTTYKTSKEKALEAVGKNFGYLTRNPYDAIDCDMWHTIGENLVKAAMSKKPAEKIALVLNINAKLKACNNDYSCSAQHIWAELSENAWNSKEPFSPNEKKKDFSFCKHSQSTIIEASYSQAQAIYRELCDLPLLSQPDRIWGIILAYTATQKGKKK